MAGSHSPVTPLSPFADPILAARLEALRQLADGLTDRVAVMDRDLNVVYANDAAWTKDGGGASASKPAKCYQAFVQMEDPCGTCPAESVFETREVRTVACNSSGDGTACGMHQAFPLMSASGEVGSVLVLFHKASDPQALQKSSLTQKLGRSRPERTESRLGDLVGASAVMHQLFDLIRLVADSSATVLIQGESGTGKELVARTIHQTSYRRDKPFVVVDCGDLAGE